VVDYKIQKSANYERHVMKLNRKDPPKERPDTEDEEGFLIKRDLYDQFLTDYWRKRQPRLVVVPQPKQEKPKEVFKTQEEKEVDSKEKKAAEKEVKKKKKELTDA
jgi:hypothetical protein